MQTIWIGEFHAVSNRLPWIDSLKLLSYKRSPDYWPGITTVLIVHRIVLFWEPDCFFQDGGQENR